MASVSRCACSVAAHAAAAVPRRARCLTRTARSPPSLLASPASPAAPSTPILDFLLPSFACRSHSTSAASVGQQAARPSQPRAARMLAPTQTRPRPGSRQLCAATPTVAQHSRRCFASTTSLHATRTLHNPQMDDDGNEMRVEITARAAARLAKVMAKDSNPRLALRIQVESGGCHGFQYVMSLVTLPDKLPARHEASAPGPNGEDGEDGEPVIRPDDTIFSFDGEDLPPPSDPLAAPKIILDTPSLELLNGSKVDFTMELIGSQFKITDNPLATSSCGCGTSFDIKV